MFFTVFFLISQLGLYYFLKSTRKIMPSHIPIVSFSLQALILYVGSFFNLFQQAGYMILFIGTALLLFTLITKRLTFSAPTFGLVVFLTGAVWFFISCFDSLTYIWSDASHWMRYIKALIDRNGFPTELSNPGEINYATYPPASSLFIAFFQQAFPARYLSGQALFAKQLLQLACMSAIISPFEQIQFSRKGRIVFAALMAVMLFGIAPYTYSLMVDDILGMVTAAGICICICKQYSPAVSLISLLPVCSFLCLTKNSAFLFVFFVVLFFLWAYWNDASDGLKPLVRNKALLVRASALMIVPLLLFVSWIIFSHIAFPEAESSNQALSISAYARRLFNHSFVFYAKLIVKYAIAIISPANNSIHVFWFVLLITVLLLVFCSGSLAPESRAKIKRLAALICFCDAVFALSMLLSYAFSFTEKEASKLASFDRYFSSMVIVHTAVLLYVCIKILFSLDSAIKKKALSFTMAVLLAFSVMNRMYIFVWPTLETHRFFLATDIINDWYARELSKVAEDRIGKNEDEQYILWLLDRSDEDKIDADYDVERYCSILLAQYYCVPNENTRMLDICTSDPEHISESLEMFAYLDNAIVILSDDRPEAADAAQSLGIRIVTENG